MAREWQSRWVSLGRDVTAFKPEIGPIAYADLPRKLQAPLTRLRLGVCKLTHQHLFERSSAPLCQHCNCALTIFHLLVDCPALSGRRLLIESHCSSRGLSLLPSTILSPGVPSALVVSYLQSVNMMDRI